MRGAGTGSVCGGGGAGGRGWGCLLVSFVLMLEQDKKKIQAGPSAAL